MKLFTWFLVFVSFNSFAFDDVRMELFTKGHSKSTIKPKEAMNMEFILSHTDNNEIIKDYRKLHGKLAHLVIFKSDLSEFNHVHPYLDPITGRFFINLNLPTHDPDNFQTTRVFNTPGRYIILLEVNIDGIGLRSLYTTLEVIGEEVETKLIADKIHNGTITKYFNRDSSIGEFGSYYMAEFKNTYTQGCRNVLNETHLKLSKFVNGNYQPISEFDPWLMMGGHALWVGQDYLGKTPGKLSVGHTHAMLPKDENGYIFSLFDDGQMNHGLQKMWIQIKEEGKVLSLPFIFDYQPIFIDIDC